MLHHSSLTTCTQAIYFAALENRAKIVENIGAAEDMITAILGAEDVAGVPYPPLQKSSGEKVKERVVQSALFVSVSSTRPCQIYQKWAKACCSELSRSPFACLEPFILSW